MKYTKSQDYITVFIAKDEEEIIIHVRKHYRDGHWCIIKDVEGYDRIVNDRTGMVLPYVIKKENETYKVLEKKK